MAGCGTKKKTKVIKRVNKSRSNIRHYEEAI